MYDKVERRGYRILSGRGGGTQSQRPTPISPLESRKRFFLKVLLDSLSRCRINMLYSYAYMYVSVNART